jgi:hypothetical protein
MLHTINEVVELTGRSRSTIYRMFDRGEINYSVGRDGKRRVETSELLRVFDDVRMDREPVPAVSHTLESLAAEARGPELAPAPGGLSSELRELRDLVRHLQDEVEHIREDNSRLLRLLEYRTYGQAAGEDAEAELDEHTVPPVTEVARGGWQQYRQQRQQGIETQQPATMTATTPAASTGPATTGETSAPAAPVTPVATSPDAADLRQAGQVLGAWLKNFFLGDWQKRDV